jgi:hypothetical protein
MPWKLERLVVVQITYPAAPGAGKEEGIQRYQWQQGQYPSLSLSLGRSKLQALLFH